jgi:DNA helicase HerA-like ATPase
MDAPEIIGYIDGSADLTTQTFQVVLAEDAVVQLDDLLVTEQVLPGEDGRVVGHYAIVVEGRSEIEGAQFASDTTRIVRDQTMPGQRVRTVEAQVLRVDPEVWVAPQAGAEVMLARGDHRDKALFHDAMMDGNTDRRLYVGLDHNHAPVAIDWEFLNGTRGGHISISGISGVATKTSYALFVLYQLMETERGRALLGIYAANTSAVIFNVKGEDLLHIDRPNNKFDADPRIAADWRALNVLDPRPFQRVQIYAPARPRSAPDAALAANVQTRPDRDYMIFGWTPVEFVANGLISYIFNDPRDRTQVGFVVEHLRATLARHAYPAENPRGAIYLRDDPEGSPHDFDQAADRLRHRSARAHADGALIRDFRELTSFLIAKFDQNDPTWVPGSATGTREAFIRRLSHASRRLGHLIDADAQPVELTSNVNVVDLHALHEDAQRFVVGAILDRVWSEKQGSAKEPLRFVMVDELNKLAPNEGSSNVRELLVDIAARGRSLGVILIGCQQNAAGVDGTITENAAIKVVGRLDAGHVEGYRFLTAEQRKRATRVLPGTMMLSQPLVPVAIPITFPMPPYATNPNEARPSGDAGGDALSGIEL